MHPDHLLWVGVLRSMQLLQTQKNVAIAVPAMPKPCHFRSLTIPSYFLSDVNSNRGLLIECFYHERELDFVLQLLK
jgi:hypothetical protein